MPENDGGFSAGPRLSAASRTPRDTPPRRPAREKPPKPPRKRFGFGRSVGGVLVTGIYRIAFVAIVLLIVGGGLGFMIFSSGLPSVQSLETYKPPLESRIYADDFQLVSELATERRIYVPFNQIPPLVVQAFVSAEDRLFWVHPGINPAAIIRASLVDLTRLGSGHRPLGASTITEQVVKNMLLDNRITFGRKVKEAILALRVEQVMTKQQIMTLYLNEIYLGNNAYGVAAAAQAYFNKPLNQLTVAEAASLGSLPKAPSSYDPFLHPDAALQRRNFVISRMQSDGAITAAQAQAAIAEPLGLQAGGSAAVVTDSGYFADAVKTDLTQRFGAQMVSEGGLIVHTSLDPALQVAAQNAVQDGLEAYDHRYAGWHGLVAHVDDSSLKADWQQDLAQQKTPAGMRAGWRLGIVVTATPGAARIGTLDPANANAPQIGVLTLSGMDWTHAGSISHLLHSGDMVMVMPSPAAAGAPGATAKAAALAPLLLKQFPNVEGALLCMDPRTGRILAMVGGWSHDMSTFNRVTQAQRQPGSSVKPFVYLTALEQGVPPDATVMDTPFVQELSNGTEYRPGNYEQGFEGPVPMYHALEQSLNLATLHLSRQIGLQNVVKNFESFGIADHVPLYYPEAIGALDTTVWRMVRGYAALAEEGRQVTPSLVDSVTDPDGQVIYQAPGQACDNCASGDPNEPPQLMLPGAQLADTASAYQIITMMKGVVLRGTGKPAVVGISQPVAGKTGTTNNFNDAWFIGFTPGVLTGCWMGYDKPQNLGKDETGGNLCGPIWNEFMKSALKNQPNLDFATPPGIALEQIASGSVTEAFKTNRGPGSYGGSGGLLAGSQNNDAAYEGGGTAGNTPASAAPAAAPAPASIDSSLGGLY